MNFSQLILYVQQQLTSVYPDQSLATSTARHLISHILQKNMTQLLAVPDIVLTPDQEKMLKTAIEEFVVMHKPLAYILGWVPFLSLHIIVRPPLLIPRPETEEWVEQLLQILPQNRQLKIVDVGTGTGCIALAIAQKLTQATVVAIDPNKQAIVCAQENATLNKINNIEFVQADISTFAQHNERFDIIVSNPPYIPNRYKSLLDRSVLDWEDPKALFADDEGLAIVREIFVAGQRLLRAAKLPADCPNLIMEIDALHGDIITEIAHSYGYENVRVLHDSNNRPRVIYATFTGFAE